MANGFACKYRNFVFGLAFGLACLGNAFADSSVEYIQEDVRISGAEIHCFEDSGENVSVIVGNFLLEIGKRTITSRDAVVWVKANQQGNISFNDITIYAQGNVVVTEPNQASTSDSAMLITLHHQGRLSASGRLSDTPLVDFPLYKRALEVRRYGVSASDTGNQDAAAPSQLEQTTQPQDAPIAEKTPGLKLQAPPAPEPKPVSLRADRFSSKEVREGGRLQRVTILHGNVYLSQGNSDSDEFVEIRAQSAVVFSLPGDTESASNSEPAAKPNDLIGSKEQVKGVYLEGDVVIARGERYFRGPKAYYDFITSRAILENGVFRTIQEQRDIPIYIRAKEIRTLSDTETFFKSAKISSSDFYSPSYHIGVSKAYLKDMTIYEEKIDEQGRITKGQKLSESSYFAKLWNPTFNVRSVPILWFPYGQGEVTDGNYALRTVEIGDDSDLGAGINTEWHLFRLLGIVRPEGFKGTANFGFYEKGVTGGVDLEYARDNFSGYAQAYGVVGHDDEDDFGDNREDIKAPSERSRVLMRHKQFLPNDWQLQAELSYMSDRNVLEKFFPSEFRGGKDQETLLYAKKQRDNWVFDVLAKARINNFLNQTESFPDAGFYVIGQKIFNTPIIWFSEQHAGIKRYRYDKATLNPKRIEDPTPFLRADTRQEINLPIQAGPVQIVPYALGRFTYWEEELYNYGDGQRPYGQVGVKAATHFSRVYRDVESRLWDINGLRHVITPEATVFLADAHGVTPANLYPMDDDIERRLGSLSGFGAAVTQRLQTKRGEEQTIVDWMRLTLSTGAFSNRDNRVPRLPVDGNLFGYRPEYSIGRNFINADYEWNISQGTALLADMNYDVDSGEIGQYGTSLSVQRSPKLSYHLGVRAVPLLDSSVGTVGFVYKIDRKYTVSFFEQYDFDFDGGQSVSTSFSIVRKLPRWYVAFTFSYDESGDGATFFMNFWPEGVPEFKVSSGRMALLGSSDKN